MDLLANYPVLPTAFRLPDQLVRILIRIKCNTKVCRVIATWLPQRDPDVDRIVK
jgi:hypothetical protein